MFRTDILEQSTLEYLWNLTDRGILKAQEDEGMWNFKISRNYIDMKDKLYFDFENRLSTLANFYINYKEGDPRPPAP